MVNKIPETWQYNENLEMLFYFYQISDELLSKTSPDTYTLPLNNSFSLLYEIEEVYNLLEQHDIVNQYYYNYIPVIIDELLDAVERDTILKKLLDKRLDAIRTGLQESKKNFILLRRWLDFFHQICTLKKYINEYSAEIERLVINTKNKKDLAYCTKNYYISLISAGYSREYLYQTVQKSFDNRTILVKSESQIKDFLAQFACNKVSMEFLVLMDIETVDYLDSISDNLILSKQITRVNLAKDRKSLGMDISVQNLLKQHDDLSHHAKNHQKIEIISYKAEAVDQFKAIEEFELYIKFLQSFSRYFKHYYPSKQIYKVLVKTSTDHYNEVKMPPKLQSRPYVKQEVIDSRIKNVLNAKAMSFSAFNTLAHAFEMHAAALDTRSTNILLKSFWTSMETIFANPVASNSHENVLNSVLPIIQKTYILKLLGVLYSQLQSALTDQALSALKIYRFEDFVEYFAANKENSSELKAIYKLLEFNPLLRSRIFELRKTLSTGNSIAKFLDNHKRRIEWQIKRIYRARNIATHIGEEISCSEVIINHIHNYFDFVIDYALCKSESGDYIASIATLVFEAQNDNKIHAELLKTDDCLSLDNYKNFLFGPDDHIKSYQFQF